MSRRSTYLVIALLFVLVAGIYNTAHAKIVYVTPTGAGNQSGTSWANACQLKAAARNFGTTTQYGIARRNDEVWIKEGDYTEGSASPYTGLLFFTFKVYGGFAGNETSIAQRNPNLHVTRIMNLRNTKSIDTESSYIDGITFINDDIVFTSTDNIFVNCKIIKSDLRSTGTGGDIKLIYTSLDSCEGIYLQSPNFSNRKIELENSTILNANISGSLLAANKVSISGSVIHNCTSGGFMITSDILDIQQSTFFDNVSHGGARAHISANVKQSNFFNNKSTGPGGGTNN